MVYSYNWGGLGWIDRNGVFGYFYHWMFPSWLTGYNVVIARYFIVFTMTVSSFLLYFILVRYLKFPIVLSFVIAVLPNIIPSMWQIPAGVNLSYPPRYLLLYLLSLIFVLEYITSREKQPIYLLLGILFYYLFSGVDIAIFTLPFTIVFIMYLSNGRDTAFHVLSAFTVITIVNLIEVHLKSRVKPVEQSLDVIFDRVLIVFEWMSPTPELGGQWVLFALISLCLIAIYLLCIKRNLVFTSEHGLELTSRKYYVVFLYAVFSIWLISNSFVFIERVNAFEERYFYISSYGMSFLLLLSLYVVLRYFTKNHNYINLVLILIIAYVGYSKVLFTEKQFQQYNKNIAILKNHELGDSVKARSQIVVAEWLDGPFYGMGWNRSSGQIRYAYGRNDINGLLVPKDDQYHFSSHINNHKKWASNYYATGLSTDFPIYLFKLSGDEIIQVRYMLEYLDSSEWIIYQFDLLTGLSSVLERGNGMDDYHAKVELLKNRGIEQKDILWGGA